MYIYIGIKYGGVKEWQYCWDHYKNTGIPSERKLLLRVLGVASDPWILQRHGLYFYNFKYKITIKV